MFEYTLKFHWTTAHASADALSCVPVEPAVSRTPIELVLLTEQISVSADQIYVQTRKDPVLGPALQYLEQGWPATIEKESPRPWSRLHLEYAGPVGGKMYLILIDAHSKRIEAFYTASSTSAETPLCSVWSPRDNRGRQWHLFCKCQV